MSELGVEIVDVTLEDVMWVKFQHQKSGCVFFVAVCYIPPVGSSRDVDVAERFLLLEEQIQRFQAEGQVVICGDFNARCGGLRDVDDEREDRCIVDMVKNEQGEMLVECMRSTGLCFVSGRKGADEFTCISSKGRSVVDYCLVPFDELANIDDFMVRTMSQCEAHLCVSEEGFRVLDHSVFMWDLLVDDSIANLTEVADKEDGGGGVQKKYVVPEGYMLGETKFIEGIIAGLRAVEGSQCRLDAVYDELVTGLKAGLKEVSYGERKKGKVWFTKELANLRKELHRRESEWLRSRAGEDRKQMRSKYLEMRQTYSKAVRRVKRSYQRRTRDKLEQELKCLKKFWKSVKKMNVGHKKRGVCDLLEVYDEDGNIKTGDEAVKVWKEHFAKVLGASNEATVNGEEQTDENMDGKSCTKGLDFSERLCQSIFREEVAWALEKVKRDAAPGKDGVTVDMMSAEVLFDVWCALFEVCWEYGLVPSVWKESLVVPVPKKQSRGTCATNTYRGISLTSTVSKVLCMILNARLSDVAEREGLITEEQGGFRKQRGCRDQVLALVLLGQTEMVRADRGMLVAFIDFAKAYDKVDRGKLWRCLEQLGVNGRFLRFLKALYQDSSCRVRVHDRLSEEFEVGTGLRQGCVLSPLLFSLYINGVVTRLHEGKCGVQCGGDMVPGLLFADDTSLVASDREGLTKSLDVLVKWCEEWGVKINVGKSGIMHMRKKTVERSSMGGKSEVCPILVQGADK